MQNFKNRKKGKKKGKNMLFNISKNILLFICLFLFLNTFSLYSFILDVNEQKFLVNRLLYLKKINKNNIQKPMEFISKYSDILYNDICKLYYIQKIQAISVLCEYIHHYFLLKKI